MEEEESHQVRKGKSSLKLIELSCSPAAKIVTSFSSFLSPTCYGSQFCTSNKVYARSTSLLVEAKTSSGSSFQMNKVSNHDKVVSVDRMC